ncbi:AAA family ATPase [Alicyclobacillus sp. SO9]|uniref:AAA family ATPase n=1 Tax=Alicyclobacillus sp. SO9 TaxID=2665646 RepID=UPI0018E7E3E0|nr:AAA family ATPase [Alicyclobacillus sp. SO9]QQE80890.1 AAA family ATPase [Alicyclobacillus sp. SO9]
MRIELRSLTLTNFKGIRSLGISFSPFTQIFGENATGKTSVVDAFLWLLFDKDSQNKKDFSVKTLSPDGKEVHFLDHAVEGVLVVDGKPVKLRKVFAEKWTKKRGSATAEFTGHTTTYYIDDVPKKAKEYKDFIDSLVNEDVFRLLTNPVYFNVYMKWEERRKTLLDIAGDVSTDEVVASNKALKNLPAILGDREIDDLRKIITQQRKKINDELQSIPTRIDEANRSKPDVEGLTESDLSREIESLKAQISLKDSKIDRLQNGTEVAEQQNKLREVEGELLEIKNSAKSSVVDDVAAQRKVVSDAEQRVYELTSKIKSTNRMIESNNETLQELRDKIQRLGAQYNEVNAEEFSHDVDGTCHACGQDLPADQVEAAHQKALEEFNRSKSSRLEILKDRGFKTKDEIQKLESENQELSRQADRLKNEAEAAEFELATAKKKLEELQSQVTDVAESSEYVAKEQERVSIANKIASLRQSVLNDVQEIRQELMDLRDELRQKETQLSFFGQIERIDGRIEELKQQERKLASEYEELEEQLYMTEEFIKTKVNLLEDKISSKFKYARFKLFDDQINGGLKETCETLYKGVPYKDMNNAARINIGLDIINTLSEHYGLTAPIFVDNAEAVTALAETQSQVIALYVSAADKKLRVEPSIEEAV